jgi:cytochrome P450
MNEVATFLSPQYYLNPYPTLRQMQDQSGIVFNKQINAWIITGYDLVEEGLHSDLLNASERMTVAASHFSAEERAQYSEIITVLNNWIVFQDPPNHTRLRRLISKSFTPRTVAALEPEIEVLVNDLLNEAQKNESFDLVSQFSFHLPAAVICLLLGIPLEMKGDLKRWADGVAGFSANARVTSEQAAHANAMAIEAKEYLFSLFAEIRKNPGENLLSKLLLVEDEANRLTDDELVGMSIQLFFAGFETTEGLIGNMVLALSRNPEEAVKLRSNPDLIENTVEEALRYDSSILKQSRVASVDTTIGGETIKKGDYLHFMIAAANRDPVRFSNPDAFEIARTDQGHLSFGHGIHFCIGAPLARLEAKVALKQLLLRLSTFEVLTPQIRYAEIFAIRKPLELILKNI